MDLINTENNASSDFGESSSSSSDTAESSGQAIDFSRHSAKATGSTGRAVRGGTLGRFFTPNKLKNLLSATKVGSAIIQNANRGTLSKDSKKELSEIIAHHHISWLNDCDGLNKSTLTKVELQNYTECIMHLFPREVQDKLIYYIPSAPPERRNPGGLLCQTYRKLKYAARNREQRELRHQQKLQKEVAVEVDQRSLQACRWLQLNQRPWELVLSNWIISAECRLKDLKTLRFDAVIAKYGHYCNDLGYQLVDEDYRILGYTEGILGWEGVISSMKPYFILKVKDEFSIAILQHMNRANVTKDTLICCTLMLLNCCVQPCKVSKTFKPSILTAQEDVFVFANDLESAKRSISELLDTYAAKNIPTHPKVVVIGTDYTALSGDFYIIFKDIVYQFNSLARAIDVIIKLCNVFKLPYSKITKLVWYVIEETLYNISRPAKYKGIEDLKKLCDAAL
ncbi:uncharacterized protein LOC131694822 [Topomyia yanbarensis]|uniref:uncharacterized protein LOC131694822 n=1 Tax=Topomyia yanbarensis TaxID=2498891 RepID=UPI00273C4AD9|nr:uncharacterized protein LOC131694822 [Topomyia yanbarensis]